MRRFTSLALLVATIALSACATTKDVKIRPGSTNALRFSVEGMSYDSVWNAASRALTQHYIVVQQDRSRGLVQVERKQEGRLWKKEYLTVFVMPAVAPSPFYTIEITTPPEEEEEVAARFKDTVMKGIKTELDRIPSKDMQRAKFEPTH